MKKAILILFILIYSLATMGFSLKEFYCCGKLKSTTFSLMQHSQQECNKGDAKGCCDNKYKVFKVKDTHISAKNIDNPANYFTDLQFDTPTFSITPFSFLRTLLANRTHAPPLYQGVSIYLYNCVFRI